MLSEEGVKFNTIVNVADTSDRCISRDKFGSGACFTGSQITSIRASHEYTHFNGD